MNTSTDEHPPAFPAYTLAGRAETDTEVPVFLKFPPLEVPESVDRLSRLLDVAKAKGWQPAINDIFSGDPSMIRYVTAPERAKFLDLLSLASNHDVLEIGPGLGQFTRVIAGRVRTVSALEVVEGQARFVAESCRQAGLRNVQVACGGDDCLLPYQDGSFDVIILSLVLEWCGDRNGTVDAPVMQERLLREMARVLRPSARAYICTKNRYALRYVLGKSDEHVFEIRFGHALPRWLMALALRLKGKGRPEGWLHSYSQLVSMVRGAGFEQFTSYWAAPEMRYPTHFIPTDTESIARARRDSALRQGETRLTNMVMRWLPASLVRHFTPGLVFVAQVPAVKRQSA